MASLGQLDRRLSHLERLAREQGLALCPEGDLDSQLQWARATIPLLRSNVPGKPAVPTGWFGSMEVLKSWSDGIIQLLSELMAMI